MTRDPFFPILSMCFCEIDRAFLLRMARAHFVEGRPTLELIASVSDVELKRAVCTIALLDVPEEYLAHLYEDDPERRAHVLSCRREALAYLAAHGVRVRVKGESGGAAPAETPSLSSSSKSLFR